MTIEDKQTKMREKFIKCDELVEALDITQATGENIILWGLGGYGKSEMAIEYFEMQGLKPFVQVMGSSTTEEKLLGGMDMKQFNDVGNIEYLLTDSFATHEYVIFEELFDAPMRVLTILKDILTSGIVRNGSQQYKIKTKMIICCTNRSKNEVIEDDSHKALLERFVLLYHVGWTSHTQEDFEELFNKRKGDPFVDLAKLIASMHSQGVHISPRTAVKMTGVWKYKGVDGLKYVDGVPHELLELMRVKHEEIVKEQKRNEAFDKLVDQLQNLQIWQTQKTADDYEPLLMNCIMAGFISVQLTNTYAPDEASGQKLQQLVRYFEEESKKWYKIAFENAQPPKKLVRPLRKLFDDYEANNPVSF